MNDLSKDTEVSLKQADHLNPKTKECATKTTVQIDSTQLPKPPSAPGIHVLPITKMDTLSTSYTRDTGVDPISMETSSIGITDVRNLRNPTRIDATTGTTKTSLSARATIGETKSAFQTADECLPTGILCASSTLKKKVTAMDTTNDSTKSTRGSSRARPLAVEGQKISPDLLRFTEAISKVLSNELAPLIQSGDQTRNRPTIHRNTTNGSIVGWLPSIKRFLGRVQATFTARTKGSRRSVHRTRR